MRCLGVEESSWDWDVNFQSLRRVGEDLCYAVGTACCLLPLSKLIRGS